MNDVQHPVSAPPRHKLWLETRALLDVAKMAGPLISASLKRPSARQGSPVIVVPGFGSDDRYTKPLRHYLTRRGYPAEGWGLGKNMAGINLPHILDDLSESWQVEHREDYRGEASVPYLCDRLAERVRTRHEELGEPISLIGWSLGGYLAREAARDLPGKVDRVITLGSPIIGGPKYTAAAPFFLKRGLDLDWIEQEVLRRETRPIQQPVTAIYSKSDAIVSWHAAVDHHNENVEHIEVDAAHVGLAFNPTVWGHIIDALKARLETQ